MELTHELVENIAELAKLQLAPEEVALYREQLSAILDYADMLNALDTDDIAPTTSMLPVSNVLREDIAQAGFSPEQALKNSPDTELQQFRVRAVLDT